MYLERFGLTFPLIERVVTRISNSNQRWIPVFNGSIYFYMKFKNFNLKW